MSKQAFDRKLVVIESLRSAPEADAREELARALKDRNNYAVSKTAAVIAARRLHGLEPALNEAFQRFLRDPVKSDPQCWAKNAIVRALKDLEYREPEIFVAGIKHVQMEPVYGGRSDTAANLRGACGLALVGCAIDPLELLPLLTDLLADHEVPARLDAARAIAHLGSPHGALPLRLKALLGDSEPEVTGQCFSALLELDPETNIAFVAARLQDGDEDVRTEAAGALAERREPEALAAVTEFFGRQTDPEVRRSLITILVASPQPEAIEFLLEVIESAPETLARQIVEAIRESRYAEAFLDRAVKFLPAS